MGVGSGVGLNTSCIGKLYLAKFKIQGTET